MIHHDGYPFFDSKFTVRAFSELREKTVTGSIKKANYHLSLTREHIMSMELMDDDDDRHGEILIRILLRPILTKIMKTNDENRVTLDY